MGNDPSAMLLAIAVVLGLGGVLRWIFRPSRPRAGRRPVDATKADLGLLTVVAGGLGRHEALEQRARLQEAGIRSSTSRRADGRFDVLVFIRDADAARSRLGS